MRRLLLIALIGSSASAQSFVKFEDSLEHAFNLDVPQGWTAKGGAFRMGYSDVRTMVDLTSPDGKINVRFGDVSIPVYFVPNQYHPTEGSIYDLGAQAQMTVAQYRNGADYMVKYAQSRFAGICRSYTPQQNSPITLPEPAPPSAPPKQSSVGQATYACDTAQGPRVVFVYAKTELFEGFWSVASLASFIAPPDQVVNARNILLRGAQSLHLNAAWIEYQKKMDAQALDYQRARQASRRRQISQQVAQFEMKMQAMQGQVQAFEHRQAAQAAQVTEWGNILTGITPTVDPMGNPKDVWTGPKSGYWQNGQGQVVNSDGSPGPGWQQLKPR